MAPGVAAPTKLTGARVSDDALILATRDGSDEAFLVLYDRYRDLAWRVARSASSNDLDAEDAVAEGFARVYAALRDRDIDSFQSYLAATVRNAAIDVYRRREHPDSEAALSEPPSIAPSVEEVAAQADESGLVAEAFATLPERYRSALWLSEVESFSTVEVGHVIGTSANGAAALTMRARERLREAYLQAHLRRPLDPDCADVTSRLATHVRGTASNRATKKIDSHVGDCRGCAGRLTELRALNESLAAAIPATPATLLAGDGILERALAQPDHLSSAGSGPAAGSTPIDSAGRLGDSAPFWADAGARLAPFAGASPTVAERVFQPVAAAVAGLLVAGAASIGGPSDYSAIRDRSAPGAGDAVVVPALGPEVVKPVDGVEARFERPLTNAPKDEVPIDTPGRLSSDGNDATRGGAPPLPPGSGGGEAPPPADADGRRPDQPGGDGKSKGQGQGQGGYGVDEVIGAVDDELGGLLGGPQSEPGEAGGQGGTGGGEPGNDPVTQLPEKIPPLAPAPIEPVLDGVQPPLESVLQPVPVTDPVAVISPVVTSPTPPPAPTVTTGR